MDNRNVIVATIIKILTPLVRIILRNGVSYGSFAELAKRTFVNVAMNDFTIKGRKQSISRVSVITGLNRKEVKRLYDSIAEDKTSELDERYNRAARVIAGWRREATFREGMGLPPELPIEGEGTTFASLVKRYSGDMPVRAVLDEMERIGAVTRTAEDRVQLKSRSYLPQTDENMKLAILGTDVGQLISTIGFNLDANPEDVRLQRKVSYDNLPEEAITPFRQFSKEQAQLWLEKLDAYLAQYDRDTNPDIEGKGRYTTGIGIYYFEESTDDEQS